MAMVYRISLAVMLLLMAGVIHFVSLVTPAWVRLGVFVPVITTRPTPAPGNSAGHMEGDEANSNMSVSVDVGGGGSDYIIGYGDAPQFVKVQLRLWEWCQEFQAMSPGCQEPEFLGGVQVLALVALVTIPLSLILLFYSACCLDGLDTRKNRFVFLISLAIAVVSGFTVTLAVTIYAVLTQREVTRMLTVIGENPDLPYLGWAFGAEVMVGVLAFLASLFICIHLRLHIAKSPPQFQPVA